MNAHAETFTARLTSATTELSYTLRMPGTADGVRITWTDADGRVQSVDGSVGSRGQLFACNLPEDDQAELCEEVGCLFDRAVVRD